MNTSAAFARHVDPTFVKLLGVLGYGRVFTHAEGAWIHDDDGRKYLDLLSGFGSANIGHNHPRLIAALRDFFDDKLLNLNHTGVSPQQAMLAERLATIAAPLDVALFSNSGAEAVEAAIKLARAATKRSRILYCNGAYHGLSLGTLSLSTSKRMRAPFEPLLPDCDAIAFDDLDALELALDEGNVAAFIVEPVQIEAGLRFASDGYLRRARELCAANGTLLIADEVQTGLGRTGAMFASHHDAASPDILVLAKSAGGSIAPIGVTMTTATIRKRAYGSMKRFDLHGSTFAGNAFACTAMIETLKIIDEEKLVQRSKELGEEFLDALRERAPRFAMRGRGLLIAIDVRTDIAGQWIALQLLERGVIMQPASQSWSVLRIEPPLTISRDEITIAVDAIGAVLDEHSTIGTLARAGKRVVAQWLNRGRFR